MLLCLGLVLQASISLADTASGEDSGSAVGDDTAATADSGTDPGVDTASGTDTSSDTAMMLPGTDSGTSACPGADSIKINEILPNPDGADPGAEWIELYNPGTEDINVGGWSVESGTSSYSHIGEIGTGVVVPAEGFLVLGGPLVTDADHVMEIYLGNASTGADAVRLVDCEGAVWDTVLYGSGNPDGWLDDDGLVAESIADMPGSDESLARTSDGLDTDACADDFIVMEIPTPGASNGSTGGGGDTGDTGDTGSTPGICETGEIKINEILPNPDGTDSGAEWVELYNPGTEDINIVGWTIESGTSSYTDSNTLDEDVTVPAEGFLVIGGPLATDADYVLDIYLGNAATGADAMRLVDCEEDVQDTVLYGSGNPDMWLDDDGLVAESIAAYPSEGVSIARLEDGQDTDQCGDDFGTGSPTPGASNAGGEGPGGCEAGTFTVKINEFLPDPDSTDANREFVELYNAGTETVSLGGWGIQTATQEFDDSFDFTFEDGATIAPGAFSVIAGSEIPGADFYLGDGNSFELGNSGTAPDGVRLSDCLGTIQDTVLYGDAGDPAEDLALTDDLGAQTMAIMPEVDFSVGRFPDGVDSDNNEVDFFTNMPPSPGSENIRGGADGDDGGGGCGCGSKDPGSSDPAPSAALGPAGLIIGLIALAGLRRREDDPA